MTSIITVNNQGIEAVHERSDVIMLIEFYMCPYSGIFYSLILIASINSMYIGIGYRNHSCFNNVYIAGWMLDSILVNVGIILFGIFVYKMFLWHKCSGGHERWVRFSLFKYNHLICIMFYVCVILSVLFMIVIIFDDDFICISDGPVVIFAGSLIAIFTLCLFEPIHYMIKVYCTGLMCIERLMNPVEYICP